MTYQLLEYALFLGSAFLVGSTVVVISRWFAGWRVVRGVGAAGIARGEGDGTNLPLWLVAASYDMFVLGVCYRVYTDGLDVERLILYYPATILGIIGVMILAYRQKRTPQP